MSYPNIDFLYLSENDMLKAGVDDVKRCTDCMEEVLKILDKGDYRMGGENGNSHGCMVSFPENPAFPNMPANGPDRRFMAMPAYVGGKFDIAGMKWYGSNVENRKKELPRSILTVMLNDKETGAPKALMSANLLSAYRTAAIPGVGVKHLAVENAEVLSIIGPGVINTTSVETFAKLRPTLNTLKIKGRGKDAIDRCIEEISEKCPQFKQIIVCDALEECVRDADILSFAISTPTNVSDYPLVKTEWIKPGALFCLPGAADFEEDLIMHQAKLVVDNISLYEAWAAEYPYPTFGEISIIGCKFMDMVLEGKLAKEKIEDLGGILNGRFPKRESDSQIILYSVGGMPVEDVAWGKEIYDYALENHIGTFLNLWETPKFF